MMGTFVQAAEGTQHDETMQMTASFQPGGGIELLLDQIKMTAEELCRHDGTIPGREPFIRVATWQQHSPTSARGIEES